VTDSANFQDVMLMTTNQPNCRPNYY